MSKQGIQPEDTFINAGNIRLHIRDWGGPVAAIPPIVLVHGLASNARIWDLLAPLLAGDFRVVALDQRGHGLSEKPADGYDMAQVASDLATAIGALGFVKPLVVGHSWGANVALQLAVDAPGLARGIILVDGGVVDFATAMSLDEALQRLAPPRLAGTPRAQFLDNLRNRWLGQLSRPEIEDIIMANFAVDEEDRIAPHLSFENHLKIVRAMWEQRPAQLFGRVTCPALIVPAEPPVLDDEAANWMEFKRRSVNLAATAILHAQVVWARQSVHDIPLHHPEFLANQIASFARGLAPRPRDY